MEKKKLKRKAYLKQAGKPKRMMIKYFVEDAKVVYEDLSDDFSLTEDAERETRTLKGKVSQELLKLLRQQLEPFSDYMQYEMAVNLTIFAYEHIIHTTGCFSADSVLDMCYCWIADEQGFFVLPQIK